MFSELDLNKALDKFYELFKLFYDLCFPVVKIKTKGKPFLNWITKGLRKYCVTKNNLRHRYYTHKNEHNRKKYNDYNKLLRKCIYNTKRQSNNNYILLNSKNLGKSTWEVINSETGKLNIDQYIDMIDNNGIIITDPTDIATAFND